MNIFERGDMVCLKLNRNEVGMVVGESNWGYVYNVRMKGALNVQAFEAVELTAVVENNNDMKNVIVFPTGGVIKDGGE